MLDFTGECTDTGEIVRQPNAEIARFPLVHLSSSKCDSAAASQHSYGVTPTVPQVRRVFMSQLSQGHELSPMCLERVYVSEGFLSFRVTWLEPRLPYPPSKGFGMSN